MKNRTIKIATFTLFGFLISCQNGDDPEPTQNINTEFNFEYAGSIGAPYANTTGITSDQENLWILSGGHNADQHTLIYYDLDSYTIEKEFVYDSLIEQLGTGVYGISCHDNELWISVSGNTNKLVKIDTANGDIQQTWTSPSILGPSDIDYDESRNVLWYSTGTGELYTINTINGGSDFIVNYATGDFRDAGMAYYNNKILVSDMFMNHIHIYDAETGNYEGYVPDQVTYSGSMTIHQDHLLICHSAGVRFYEIIN
ncbi:MAG: hypothetical protein ABJG68_02125 [Crocinitomicaceae bacterium]